MKKLLLSIITFLAFTPIFAVDINTVVGTYKGVLNVTLGEGEEAIPAEPQEGILVYLEKEASGTTCKLLLKDFSFQGAEIGDIEVGNISLDDNGVITAPEVTLEKPGLGKLPTKLSGTIINGKADLAILVQWNVTNDEDDPYWMPIHVTYSGTKEIDSAINNATAGSTKLIQNGNILSVSGAGISSFSIYNMSGSLVAAKNHHASAINIDALPYGVYIVKIITDNQQTITRKIYKK